MKDIKKKIITSIITIVLLLVAGGIIVANYTIPPHVIDVEMSDSKRFSDKVVFNIRVDNFILKFDKSTWCYITKDSFVPDINSKDWIKASEGYCSFTTDGGLYNIFVKDSFGNVSDIKSQKIEINKILRDDINKDVVYLYKGREENLSYTITKLGTVNENLEWKAQDSSIVSVDKNGLVTGKEYGSTYVEAISNMGTVGKVKVIVTDLITKPVINLFKPYLSCKQFTLDEANMLDEILFDRINDAGYATRAGVVEAARFLALEFNYRIHYFFENGRLNNYEPYIKVDGEGRYYHKGLFLSEDKYAELSPTFEGPAMWGCELKNFTNSGSYVKGHYYPNGFDCSGFVTWALLNGGFDVGDIGAGASKEHYDLDDIGEKVSLSEELLNSDRIKIGDLIGNNGHMAIIAGRDNDYYYIAESLDTTKGVVMSTVPKNQLVSNSIYRYVILMDNVYKHDGNLTEMWN